MLQIHSTVYEHTIRKINSKACFTKTYHESKPFLFGTFVLKRNFSHVHFLTNSNRFGLYHIKYSINYLMLQRLSQGGSTFHIQRNHLIPSYPEKPLQYPHLRNFMRFSDSTHYDIPKPINYAKSDSSPLNSDVSLSDENSSQDDPTSS